MKTSPYEEKLNLINKFVSVNSPSNLFDRDIRNGESQSPDLFITGTSEELVKYVNENYLPPSKNREEWKDGEKYLLTKINENYFNDILKNRESPTGFIFFYQKRNEQGDQIVIEGEEISVHIEMKSFPFYILQKTNKL